MKHCPSCNNNYYQEFEFCPKCGAKLTEEPAGEQIEKSAPKKKYSRKKKLTIGGVVLAVLIIIGIFAAIMAPRQLIIYSGEDIEMYVGEDMKIKTSADGLEPADYKEIIWTTDDENLLKIEDGRLEASYDKNAFNAVEENSNDSNGDNYAYTSYIHGNIQKGMRRWEGSAKVVVSLKPVEIESGKVIKEPADPRNSSIVVTGSDEFSSYFYLKSKTKSSNDMSFVIKKGETSTVYVPCDTYTIYEADGDTWYGENILFGPKTFYTKDSYKYEFTSGTYWTLELGVKDGDVTGKSIGPSDFPE